MGIFSNLTKEGMAEVEDRVGGSFEALPSDIYEATVKMAFAGQSAGGAHRVTLILDAGGREVREDVYVTNKKGENFYVDKQDGKTKHLLPGFVLMDDLAMFATDGNLGIADLDTEEKIAKVFDPESRKEVNQPVQAFTDLHGFTAQFAIQREIVDRRKMGEDGKYHPTGETRTQNVIQKVMHPETRRTVLEYKHGVEEDAFAEAWLKANQGKDRNRSTKNGGDAGPGAAGSGRPASANAANPAPRKAAGGLFGK